MTFDPSILKILFFDVGNVFVSDDPSGCFIYESLYKHVFSGGENLTETEYFQERTRHAEQGGTLWSFVAKYIPQDEFPAWQREIRRQMYSQWSIFSPPVPGMDTVARRLATQYRLGIIANQPPEVEGLLAERGLLDLFDIKAISGSIGLDKPDPRLYEWALEKSGVRPQEAMMIGDRIDNDVVPAKKVGMQTTWLKLNAQERAWQPITSFQQCYAQSLAKSSWNDRRPKSPSETPDLIAETPQELLDKLTRQTP